MTAELPRPGALPELAGLRRPRLRADRPVLWRGATTISLGDAVRVSPVTREHVAWLARLDGLRDPTQIAAELPIAVVDARRLLRAAIAAAALEDAAHLPDTIRWAAPEERAAAWGRFGAAIDAAGSVSAGFEALAARAAARVDVVGDGPLAAHVRTALHHAGLSTQSDRPPTVTVLTDLTHPDAPDALMDLDGPHLPVSAWGRRAVVGPLVDPGRSSCLRCAQLHRRDADPAWPLVAVQWAQAIAANPTPPVDPLLASVAGLHAALLARAWVDDTDGPWTELAVEVTLPTGATTVHARPAHPLCGCRWRSSGLRPCAS